MRKFEVTILGASSALPTASRFPTSQMVNMDDRYFLVDCGEGTQMQIRKYHLSLQRIERIFISHMHGDHYFGLFGLITSMELLGRQKELTIYGPPDLEGIIESVLSRKLAKMAFDLTFTPIAMAKGGLLYQDEKTVITAFPVKHSSPCVGFAFEQVNLKRRLIGDLLNQHEIPTYARPKLQLGEDFVKPDGTVVANDTVTLPPHATNKYVFMTDTYPLDQVPEVVKGAQLLYHEATFLNGNEERALQTKHSTTGQAADFAIRAGVEHLMVGHYSTRYKTLEEFEQECQTVFPKTRLAIEGDVHKVE